MITLVFGASSSGKSRFSEELACAAAAQAASPLVYLATMQPYGDEGRARVVRHRAQREGKGFTTVECYGSLIDAQVNPEGTVLLECLGNLVANLQFGTDWQERDPHYVFQQAIDGFDDLAARCSNLIVVSNDVSDDSLRYDGPTKNYINIMGKLTNAVALRADAAYEVVAGIPIALKEPSVELRP